MYIHILEDIKEQREYIKLIIKEEVSEKKYDMKVGIVERDPYIFYENIQKLKDNEGAVYFFDIDLKKDITGFDVAKKIRELDYHSKVKSHIVFITQYSELMFLTFKYKLESFDFIPKGHITDIREKIGACLEGIYKKYMEGEKKLQVFAQKKDMLLSLNIEDIVMITISKKNIIVITAKNTIINTRASIKEIELKLRQHDFIKPNQSSLVNRSHIRQIDLKGKKLILDDGMECKISNRKLKEFS